MSNITYRLVKGQELTFAEIDENFSSLDSDIRGNRRYFDSTLEQFGLGRDSDFLAILAQRDSDAAAIILLGMANHDSDIADLNARGDSEHAWNVAEHDSIQQWTSTNINRLDDRSDSEHSWNVAEHASILATVGGLTDTTYTAGSGLTLTGTVFSNPAPDQTVVITGSGATSVTGTYPNFTVSSTDNNTTYTAGSGITLTGTQFINAAPDQTVSFTNGTGISVTGTYPNFTVTNTSPSGGAYVLPTANNTTLGGVRTGYAASGRNYGIQLSSEQMYVNVPWTDTTYTAGNGLTLSGTQFTMSGSYTGTFTATGDVVAYSDMALKSEVTAIDEALDKLMAITGYTYNTKGSDRRHSGVMAQDVEEVLPEVVHTSEDGTKGVAYGNMMGLVIEAIRELKTQVDELKGR